MTIYEESVAALKDYRTIAAHITNLGKVMNTTQDQKLKTLLNNVIARLQSIHADPKVSGKSTPRSLYETNHLSITQLVGYCNTVIGTKKPEWQVEAERNNWGPKP